MTYEQTISLATPYFTYWIKNPTPEVENYLFNELESATAILSLCYYELVKFKKITRLEDIDSKIKQALKEECKRICPNYDRKKGMQICKTIQVFGYLSNVL